MAFGKLRDVIDKTLQLSIENVAGKVMDDPTLQAQVLDLNTEAQLYEQGVDAAGNSLGGYAPYTIEYKQTLAGTFGNDTRDDHVTLKDTGEFYRSFRFIKQTDGFQIEADTIKEDHDLAQLYGPKILGLTDESIQQIIPEIRDRTRELVRKQIVG